MHDGAAIPSPQGDRRAVVMSGAREQDEAPEQDGAPVPGPSAPRASAPEQSGPGPSVFGPSAPELSALVVSTARLRLTPVAEHELDELYDLHSDPRAFAEDLTEPLTDRRQMSWVLEQWQANWAEHGLGHLAVRSRPGNAGSLPPGLLGVVGLAPLELEGRTALSAYWRLSPAATGHGVATEAMHAVLTHPQLGGRGAGTGTGIVAVTAAGNRPSRALAARLGFIPAPPERPVPGGRSGDVLLVLGGS